MNRFLKFFAYGHLAMNLQDAAKPFYTLAHAMAHHLPGNPESTVMMRKLLEAKDCAVRAVIEAGGDDVSGA